jgi:transglutaminase-like putative cysteine protease
MKIRFGYDISYNAAAGVPMVLLLSAQPNSRQRLLQRDTIQIEPRVPISTYRDVFGNVCSRFICPGGLIRLRSDGVLRDSGLPEPAAFDAREEAPGNLPDETLMYLLASRYCETDLLMDEAWRLFGHLSPGWQRVQAICDFVHQHVSFGYQYADSTKTAFQTYIQRQGVCRDMAHLAVTFCRCMNIPARYCSSYLGDIGVPVVPAPMDFAGCMEVFLGGEWHAFDPRNNARRIGRLMIARGRDAADTAISTAFGSCSLQSFRVWTDEMTDRVQAWDYQTSAA